MNGTFPTPARAIRAGRLWLLLWAVLLAGRGVSAADRITRVDGTTAAVHVVAIDGERVVLTNATPAAVVLGDLWRIEVAPTPMAVGGLVERLIFEHGEIPARRLTFQDGLCRFDWTGGNEAGVTQTLVRAMILKSGAEAATREATERALEKTIPADQVVALGPNDAVLTLEGSVKNVGTNAIVLEYQGKDRTLNRAKVGAVVFGRTGTTDRAAGVLTWKATVAGGAWLEGDDARLANGTLVLTMGASSLAMPWSKVCSLEHRDSKVRFLSRMDPVQAIGGAIVALALPWQRDRSAMNRPLRLRGEIHESGLGTHAPSELVFDVPAGAQRFLAVVGLDEEFGRGGDCVVVVRVDEREALRQRLRGSDKPLPVDIEIRTGRRLTLRAEPGENHDIGDHVNWYDARLLLAP